MLFCFIDMKFRILAISLRRMSSDKCAAYPAGMYPTVRMPHMLRKFPYWLASVPAMTFDTQITDLSKYSKDSSHSTDSHNLDMSLGRLMSGKKTNYLQD